MSETGTYSDALLTLTADGALIVNAPLSNTSILGGTASINQLWKRTQAGNIVSAAIPNMALTAPSSGGTLTVSPLAAGNTGQVWNWGNGQMVAVNAGKQKLVGGTLSPAQETTILTVSGELGSAVTLASPPASGITGNDLWYTLPHAMPFGSSTTIRNAGDGNSPGLFLSMVDKADTSGGYEIQVGGTQSSPTFSMWQYQFPGYLVNNANDDIVLSLEPEANGNPVAPAYTSNVVAYPRQPRPQAFQLWDITPEGCIINRFNGEALTIPPPTSTPVTASNVITATIATDPGTSWQVWEYAPGMALQAVLQQPMLPFPAFTGDALTVYQKISAKLGLADGVRSQYMNMAAPLNNYQSEMNLMLTGMLFDNIKSGGSTPTAAEIQNCGNVITRLNREIAAVVAVQGLFQQATALYLSLSQGQVMTLEEMITACALPNGIKTIVPPPKPKKKKSWIGDLIEGITYTALNVAGSFIGDPEAGTELSFAAKTVKNGFPASPTSCLPALTPSRPRSRRPAHPYPKRSPRCRRRKTISITTR